MGLRLHHRDGLPHRGGGGWGGGGKGGLAGGAATPGDGRRESVPPEEGQIMIDLRVCEKLNTQCRTRSGTPDGNSLFRFPATGELSLWHKGIAPLAPRGSGIVR